ncbi:GntR family transcriptional regulator [Paraburkholderia caribensis]|uniref:GntR family transcriptional regulator n=1 Tax=Paraburkholderia caribensis TaxID=75105 RepID=UPI0031D0C8B2
MAQERVFQIISSAPLRQQVAEMLRRDFARGKFRPGQRLLERDLCEMTGVSRTSVREALRELETEGLVVTLPVKGPIVAPITLKAAEDIYEARLVLEGEISRLFARRAKAEDRAALHTSLAELDDAYLSGEIEQLLDAKERFYAILVRGADNAVLSLALRSIHVRSMQLRSIGISHPHRNEESHEQLKRLGAALLVGDEEAAWQRCREHVEGAAAAALSSLREQEKSSGHENVT